MFYNNQIIHFCYIGSSINILYICSNIKVVREKKIECFFQDNDITLYILFSCFFVNEDKMNYARNYVVTHVE